MSNILSVKNLSVRLEGETILRDVSFDVISGESLAIVGPNGAGKTVLLKTLLGMMPHEGKIEWAKGAKIGYVPQKIDADRHLPITLKNLIAAKAAILKFSKEKADADIRTLSREVGLSDASVHTPIGHLSGGQFQRALIAFALLGNPNIILLDEPTASIDTPGEEQIYELIHELQDKYGMTTVLISHDISFVYKYATKVLCLNKRKVCFGTPAEALTPESLEALYGPHKYFHHDHPKNKHTS